MDRIVDRKKLRLLHRDLALIAEDILRAGCEFSFKARGQSMRPWIRDGDCLHIAPVEPQNVRRGDVLFCRTGDNHLVAHRVIQVRKNIIDGVQKHAFKIQGDAHSKPDGTVQPHQVLGRVTYVERSGIRDNCSSLSYRLCVWAWLLPPTRRVYWRFLHHLIK